MKRYAALLIGIVAAVGFARLGFWQLSRKSERQAHNEALAARLSQPVVVLTPTGSFPHADSVRYRRATAVGRFDFDRQMAEIGRSLNGVPGVHVLTPMMLDDSVGVLVDRGWTYSADGSTVAWETLREADTAVVEGVLGLPSGRFGVRPDTLRLGFAVLPLVLHRTTPAPGMPAALRPVPLPAMTGGPHLSYAIQWFSFATIALVGGWLLARRDRSERISAEGSLR